ncbi:MAG: hypothetical protein Q9166_008152 [cf. Caloplaca sp. 2 TL-2023]
MNETASLDFVSALRAVVGADWVQLQQATGMLLGRPPLTVTQSTTTQVTRKPRAPFITLIALDLVYSTTGMCLMIAVLIGARKGRSVRDVQARISTLAVVAESFESPAVGDNAKDVKMLFAQRRGRGESTRRIALVRQRGGGRRFKQTVSPQNYVKGLLPHRNPICRRTASLIVAGMVGRSFGKMDSLYLDDTGIRLACLCSWIHTNRSLALQKCIGLNYSNDNSTAPFSDIINLHKGKF